LLAPASIELVIAGLSLCFDDVLQMRSDSIQDLSFVLRDTAAAAAAVSGTSKQHLTDSTYVSRSAAGTTTDVLKDMSQPPALTGFYMFSVCLSVCLSVSVLDSCIVMGWW